MSSSVPSSGSSAASATSNLLLSAHRDVLEAPIPDSSQAKQALIDELKNRARSAVSAKAYRDAQLLYQRAIDVCSSSSTENDNRDEDARSCSILYANLSLTFLNMGMYEEARRAAARGVELDGTYVKGLWRLGQALSKLSRSDEALGVLKRALALDPTNRALQKEVQKLQEQVREEEEVVRTSMMEVDTTKDSTTTAPPVTSSSSSSKSKAKSSSSSSSSKVEDMDHDEDHDTLFTKSDHVRGYKVVDGKKTSYFHRELDEEEKKMIGDIAPKRIDNVQHDQDTKDTATTATTTSQSETGTSAWNKAGTWEERDVTTWAKETLETALLSTRYVLPESSPAPGAVATITKVTKVDGHASYATVRGKKRYIYEFYIQLEWEFHDKEQQNMTAKGSMAFPDFDGTCEVGEGYEMINFTVNPDTPPQLRPILDRLVKNDGLRDAIHGTLDEWVRLFNATY